MCVINDIVFHKLSPNALVESFEHMLEKSKVDILLTEKNKESGLFVFDIKLSDESQIRIMPMLRNISGGGWKNKQEILRIQIGKPKQLKGYNEKVFNLLCGIGSYKNEDFVFYWNPRNYQTHVKNCSCYVYISSIEKAYKTGFYKGLNMGKEVMVCRADCIQEMFRELMNRYL